MMRNASLRLQTSTRMFHLLASSCSCFCSCSWTLLLLILIGCSSIPPSKANNDDGCNEVVCGSVVSKCLITQSCQCKMADCHCCKDCLNCLGELYTECCGCLDMCPKHKDALPSLTPRSEIGDIEGLPVMFDTLTAEDDDDQWSTIRFPMRAGFKQRVQGGGSSSGSVSVSGSVGSTTCTVIYVNSCIRANKCRQQCESMGASSYRWFHDGCCECVGDNCLNYGINESRCRACPEDQDLDQDLLSSDPVRTEADQYLDSFFGNEDDDEDSWGYGEDEDFI